MKQAKLVKTVPDSMPFAGSVLLTMVNKLVRVCQLLRRQLNIAVPHASLILQKAKEGEQPSTC